MKNLGYLVIFLLLWTACKETSVPKDINKQVNISKIDTISYEVKNISKEKGDCGEEPKQCIQAKIDYIVINQGINADATAKINTLILDAMKRNAPTVESNLDSFILEADSFFKEFPDEEVGYSMEAKQAVVFNSTKLLVVEENIFSYTGGAHGNYGTVYYNFDVVNGKLLTLTDILKDGYETELTAKAEQLFKAAYLEDGASSLSEVGFYFDDDKFTLTDNFAITEKGLKFLYNPYEVAPYALGQQEIVIPSADLKTLIKSGGVMDGLE